MLIVTTAEEQPKSFLKSIIRQLPKGPSINYSKTKIYEFKKDDPPAPQTMDYLGYKYVIPKPSFVKKSVARTTTLDIANKKVARMKTRIVLSLRKFHKNKNFADLVARIKILTGNYNLYDKNTGITRNVGLYFNYSMIDAQKSEALRELDRFWSTAVAAKNGPLAKFGPSSLTKEQKRQLLRFKFQQAFRSRPFYHFPTAELSRHVRCWTYA